MIERSCGTIPYTVKENTIYYLLIRSKESGYCGFPKGHMESDESEIETALRETLEETSVKVSIDREARYEITYKMRNGNDKAVVYYIARFQDQSPSRYNGFEDFEYLLLPFDRAYREISFENTREILKKANDFLIRKK